MLDLNTADYERCTMRYLLRKIEKGSSGFIEFSMTVEFLCQMLTVFFFYEEQARANRSRRIAGSEMQLAFNRDIRAKNRLRLD